MPQDMTEQEEQWANEIDESTTPEEELQDLEGQYPDEEDDYGDTTDDLNELDR